MEMKKMQNDFQVTQDVLLSKTRAFFSILQDETINKVRLPLNAARKFKAATHTLEDFW